MKSHTKILTLYIGCVTVKSVSNFTISKSIFKDKNDNKFENKLAKAFRDMHLQCYI